MCGWYLLRARVTGGIAGALSRVDSHWAWRVCVAVFAGIDNWPGQTGKTHPVAEENAEVVQDSAHCETMQNCFSLSDA